MRPSRRKNSSALADCRERRVSPGQAHVDRYRGHGTLLVILTPSKQRRLGGFKFGYYISQANLNSLLQWSGDQSQVPGTRPGPADSGRARMIGPPDGDHEDSGRARMIGPPDGGHDDGSDSLMVCRLASAAAVTVFQTNHDSVVHCESVESGHCRSGCWPPPAPGPSSGPRPAADSAAVACHCSASCNDVIATRSVTVTVGWVMARDCHSRVPGLGKC